MSRLKSTEVRGGSRLGRLPGDGLPSSRRGTFGERVGSGALDVRWIGRAFSPPRRSCARPLQSARLGARSDWYTAESIADCSES